MGLRLLLAPGALVEPSLGAAVILAPRIAASLVAGVPRAIILSAMIPVRTALGRILKAEALRCRGGREHQGGDTEKERAADHGST